MSDKKTQSSDLWVVEEAMHASWPMTLDPTHEIAPAPAVEGILPPEGYIPAGLQIAARASRPKLTATEVWLQEELKVDAGNATTLWERIRNLFALLLWSGPAEEEAV